MLTPAAFPPVGVLVVPIASPAVVVAGRGIAGVVVAWRSVFPGAFPAVILSTVTIAVVSVVRPAVWRAIVVAAKRNAINTTCWQSHSQILSFWCQRLRWLLCKFNSHWKCKLTTLICNTSFVSYKFCILEVLQNIPPGSCIATLLPVSPSSPIMFTARRERGWATVSRFSPSLSVPVPISILVAAAAGPLRGRVPSGVRHLIINKTSHRYRKT